MVLFVEVVMADGLIPVLILHIHGLGDFVLHLTQMG
jgi:hypothetical protein